MKKKQLNDPHILVSDDSGHDYLIPEKERSNFYHWASAMENNDMDESERYLYDFNSCRVDLPRLKILDWREE
jgi:hypothetical protein